MFSSVQLRSAPFSSAQLRSAPEGETDSAPTPELKPDKEVKRLIAQKDKDTSPGLEDLDYEDLDWMLEHHPDFPKNLAAVCERIANNEIRDEEIRKRLIAVKGER